MKNHQIEKLAVFCGSSIGNNNKYSKIAEGLASSLVEQNITLVYGGAKVGLMGVMAEKVLQLGGKAIGVIPQSLVDVEIAHMGLTELHVVNSMHERKAVIAKIADGFILMPGGPGSLDEFFEVFTWGQLGYHQKPCGILNCDQYYDKLIGFLDFATQEGFMKAVHKNMILVNDAPAKLLQQFQDYVAPTEHKWINQETSAA